MANVSHESFCLSVRELLIAITLAWAVLVESLLIFNYNFNNLAAKYSRVNFTIMSLFCASKFLFLAFNVELCFSTIFFIRTTLS